MVKIFGLTGQTGSGKDAVCEYMKKKEENVVFVRFSTPLTKTLAFFTTKIRKEDQQWLAHTLRQRFGDDVLVKAVKKEVDAIKKGIVILNGVRYPEDNEFLQSIGGKLIFVDADIETRWKRTCKRGEKADDNSTLEQFLEREKAPTEVKIKALGKISDFIITNNGSLQTLHNQIDKILDV